MAATPDLRHWETAFVTAADGARRRRTPRVRGQDDRRGPRVERLYTGADPRVEFLADLGFEIAPSVEEFDTGLDEFTSVLSEAANAADAS